MKEDQRKGMESCGNNNYKKKVNCCCNKIIDFIIQKTELIV